MIVEKKTIEIESIMSVSQYALKIGKTVQGVRWMLKENKLKGKKIGTFWMVFVDQN